MNRSKHSLWLAFFFTSLVSNPAQSAESAVWGYLENGASYLILPNHSAPMVGCSVVIHHGSAAEDWSTQGASHFLEHLLFNGTTKLTQEELYAGMDRLGAYSNASTRNNHVNFMILCGTEEFWPTFDLQRQMLFESTLAEDKIEKERGIILEELAKDQSQSNFELERILDLDLFGTGGYGLPTLGSETSIRSLTADQIRTFYDNYYVPNEMTWILVGDVDPVAALDSLQASIGKLPAKPVLEATVPGFDAGPRIRRHRAEVEKTTVRVTWQAPSASNREYDAFGAFFDLLIAGDASPFATALKSEIDWSSYQAGRGSLPDSPSYLSIKLELPVSVSPQDLERGLAVAGQALMGASLSEGDLEGWKIQEETGEIFLREKPHYYGIFRADELVNRGLPAFVHRLDAVETVSLETVESFRGMLAKPAFRMSWIEPLDKESPTSASGASGSGWDAVNKAARPNGLETWTLGNGAQVAVLSGPESSVLAIHTFVQDRSLREPDGQAGVAELLHRLLGAGTERHSSESLEKALRSIGAEWKAADSAFIPYDDHYSVPGFSFLRFQTLDRFAEEGFSILASMVGTPSFTEEGFEKERQALLSRAAGAGNTARERARRELAESIGSLSPELFGTEASLAALEFDQVETFASRYFDPAKMLFVVGSGLPMDELRTLTESTLGKIPTVTDPIVPRATGRPDSCPWRTSDDVDAADLFGSEAPLPLWIDDRNDEQSYLILSKWIEAPDEAEAALKLANGLISEAIAFQLREREGLAYSIGSSIEKIAPGRWVWTAAAGTRPENLPRMLEGLRAIPDDLFADLPTAESLATRTTKMKGRALMRRVTRMNWAYHAGLALRNGQSGNDLNAAHEEMSTLSPEEVQAAYRTYFEQAPAAVFLAK